jgi:hypothetical protein
LNKKGSVRISRAERKALFSDKIKQSQEVPAIGSYDQKSIFDDGKGVMIGLPTETKQNSNPGPG